VLLDFLAGAMGGALGELGVGTAARSKKPIEKALTPSGPTETIEKYFG
jgi:hypothetical protein